MWGHFLLGGLPDCLDQSRGRLGLGSQGFLMSVFTDKEFELSELVSLGLPNKEIAYRIGIASGSVKEYLHLIYRKHNIHSRTELALLHKQKDQEELTLP